MSQGEGQEQGSGAKSLLQELPLDRLMDEARNALDALTSRAAASAGERIEDATGRLTDYAKGGEGGGGSPVASAVAEGVEAKAKGNSPIAGALKGGLSGLKDKAVGALTGGGGSSGGGGKETKVTNIIETIDVGVPVTVAYNAWNEFQEWSGFMKKVEDAERQQDDEAKIDFKAQVFWSHRRWEATVIEQVPDERIVWRSKGEKGHVDGAVTFHEIGPNLTRILVVLEYHPQGLFEKTGNIWRAQGRRARLELKHFRRHVMTRTILHPEEVEGWRGEIRDEEVVESHEDALEREEEGREEESAQDDFADEEDQDDEDLDEEDLDDEDDYDDEDLDDEDVDDEELADDELADEDLDEEELADEAPGDEGLDEEELDDQELDDEELEDEPRS